MTEQGTTHDYNTDTVAAKDVDSSMVLVGESGGLSSVYNNGGKSYAMEGCISIETEHGTLYVDADEPMLVLAEDP